MHNFNGTDAHTHFVGSEQWWVHNCGRPGTGQPANGATSATAYGRQEHDQFFERMAENNYNGRPFETDSRLPGGQRPDAFAHDPETRTGVVIEYKPDNPREVRRGWMQVSRYKAELSEVYRDSVQWTGIVMTYVRPK